MEGIFASELVSYPIKKYRTDNSYLRRRGDQICPTSPTTRFPFSVLATFIRPLIIRIGRSNFVRLGNDFTSYVKTLFPFLIENTSFEGPVGM
jgi:hypothetical protein